MKADRDFFVCMVLVALCFIVSGLLGCYRAPAAQEGGKATTLLGGFTLPHPTSSAPGPASGTATTLQQSQNPAAVSSQSVKRTETRQDASPVPVVRVTETPTPAGIVKVTEQFGQPPLIHTVSEETATVIGPSFWDTSREIAAKMAGTAGIRAFGFALVVFALACFHPVVRAVVGAGKTIPALAAVAGVICIFGPSIFAGHETLVLCLVAGGLAVAFLLVRLSHKEGQADALRSSPPPAG